MFWNRRYPIAERRVRWVTKDGIKINGLVLWVRCRFGIVGAWMYRVACLDGEERSMKVTRCRGNRFHLEDYHYG